MIRKHIKKLALIACTLATVSTANAALFDGPDHKGWFSTTWRGYTYVNSNSKSWVENWVSANEHKTWQDNIGYGPVQGCSNSPKCQVTIPAFSKNFNDVSNFNATYQLDSINNSNVIWYLNEVYKAWKARSSISSQDQTVNINQGQTAVPYLSINRKYSWATVRGYGYYTGDYGHPYIVDGKTFAWWYDWDSNGNVGILNGFKSQGSGLMTWKVINL